MDCGIYVICREVKCRTTKDRKKIYKNTVGKLLICKVV